MGSDRIYQSSHSGTDKDKNDAIFLAGTGCWYQWKRRWIAEM